MKKVMISQKMINLSPAQILETKNQIVQYLQETVFPYDEIEIISTFFTEDPPPSVKFDGVWYLGNSILKMSEADLLVVEPGAEESRGCKIEISVAKAYGLDVLILDSSAELNKKMKRYVKGEHEDE